MLLRYLSYRRAPYHLFLLLLVMLACSLPTIGSPDPTPAPPTPLGDTLLLTVPLYTITLDPGDTVPGTHLTYVRQTDDAYEVTIDGLPATKRVGDSFAWRGVVGPGVAAVYDLRIGTALLGRLVVSGPVELNVLNPEPAELRIIEGVENWLYYSAIAVQYLIPAGRPIPGTTLVYEGQVEQGAALSGTDGYPYRALGDSLIWLGTLGENVTIRYSLRVAGIDDNGLHLAGTAELWVKQAQ